MSKERKIFKSEEHKHRSEVSDFLHQIAGKIGEGQVILRQGQQEIILELPENLVLEIQVEEENKRERGLQHSLEIEIKWTEGAQGGGDSGPLELG
jgi:amphi-Trp domain-containing protein